ncbi:MAG: CDP-alcohol phosphatidyltransferase family protein [Actinomycetota bacterium]|jgi:phosphatidylglycerophosphate synthase|nr:CDP-alcohol phosphatidyltransferase family protein [Actinomycetota bacterium]
MFDVRIRQALTPALDAAGRNLAASGVRPGMLTGAGWLLGVGAGVAAGLAWWPAALGLWLANRLFDGLDGPVARARGTTDVGGFLDVVADFTIYAGFVVGVAVAVPQARVACLVLLSTYYVSGTALLAQASLLERRRQAASRPDERALRLVGGLAEGTETIVVYVLFCLFHASATGIAWTFAGVVAVTALQRVVGGVRLLRAPVPLDGAPSDIRSWAAGTVEGRP